MLHGKHIVLEGPDASGKKTQSELLVKRLNASPEVIGAGKRAERIGFPRYEEPYGRMVTQYLSGLSPSADPAYASILYAADRRESVPMIKKLLEKGNWVVCDRYVESNLAHQVARAGGKEQQEILYRWILDTEYNMLGIPRADLTILLNVPIEIVIQKNEERSKQENRERDRHERDGEHLLLSWQQYQKLAKEGEWPVVNCAPHGKLLSREEIAERIWEEVQRIPLPKL